ncbi:MAG: hypothetical protein BMS9Abin26_2018 [Gammaproteobacteria bacterium]|nr:MAG: hypothetical protein BMS9Abin26_2018 [Gammaproteobacteria bacterium]
MTKTYKHKSLNKPEPTSRPPAGGHLVYSILMGAVLSGTSLVSSYAQGAEWYMEPSVTAKEQYDDNVRLSATNQTSTWATFLLPELKIGSRTETSEIDITGRAEFSRYHSAKELNSDDQFLNFSGSHRNERNRWAVDIDYERDSTLRTLADDTGRVGTEALRVETARIAPSWTHVVSEKSTLNLGASYTDVHYPDPGNSNLSDSETTGVSGSWQYQWTTPTVLFITGYANKYEQDTGVTSTTIEYFGVNLGFDHKLTETFSVSASIGRQESDSEQKTRIGNLILKTGGKGSGLLFNVSAEKNTETTRYKASLNRSTSPSVTGNLNNRDEFKFNYNRRLTEKMNVLFEARYLLQESSLGNNTNNDRKFWVVSPALSWQMSRNWYFNARYRHRYQKYDNANRSADSDRVLFTVRYDWDRKSLSR